MRNLALTRTIAGLGALAVAAWAGQAYALEPGSSDPHLPGVSDGVPAGALPPPGFYFVNTAVYQDGSVTNNNGKAVGANITAWLDIPGVTWVTPWHILGASYAMAFAAPIPVTLAVTAGGVTQNRTGIFNPIIVPAILSWHLPAGFFVSGSLPIYLPAGDTDTDRAIHIANNTTTFAPSAAISWFNGHGLETSINAEYDIQTTDGSFHLGGAGPSFNFSSGDVLNLDFTAVQVLPGAYKKWTVGGVGYYAVQTNNDSTNIPTAVQTVAGINTAARFEKFGIGPYVGYDFGPVGMNFWYTRDLFANNTAQADTFFFRFAIPL